MDKRSQALQHWLSCHFGAMPFTYRLLAGDASFRRYFRVSTAASSWIAMDAPPQQESCQPFVAIAQAWRNLGVQVPEIICSDLDQGFLLLSDFGDEVYLKVLRPDNATTLYHNALLTLSKIQRCHAVAAWPLPTFDQRLILQELALFEQWFLAKHLNSTLSATLQRELAEVYQLCIEVFAQQPQVCVHRDYHSRNLMYLPDQTVGVLDFQDAVWGPLSYDAVSLFKDCYIDWPTEQVATWLADYHHLLTADKLLTHTSLEEWTYWFDITGLQRHLKVLGIFARLCHRDNKPNYLRDLPRIFTYLLTVCQRYPALLGLQHLLQEIAEPAALATAALLPRATEVAKTAIGLPPATAILAEQSGSL